MNDFLIHYLAVHVSDCHQSTISLAVAWKYIHATAILAYTNIPMRYTVYEMMLSTQQPDSPARTYQYVIQFMR